MISDEELDALIRRYFAGDLDAVERRELARALERDPARRAAFDEAYDAHTETNSLLSLPSPAPERRDCFSPRTLELRAEGKLTPEDARLVDGHLDCPFCRAELDSYRAAKPPARLRVLRIVAPILAAAAAVLLFVFLQPEPEVHRGSTYFDTRLANDRFFIDRNGAERVWSKNDVLQAGEVFEVHLANTGGDPLYYAVFAGEGERRVWIAPSTGPESLPALAPGGTASIPIEKHTPELVVIVVDRALTAELLGAALNRSALDAQQLSSALKAEVLIDRAVVRRYP